MKASRLFAIHPTDTLLSWKPKGQKTVATCFVRIGLVPPAIAGFPCRVVVMLIEDPDNEGMSITNGFEQIATIIARELVPIALRGHLYMSQDIEWYEQYADTQAGCRVEMTVSDDGEYERPVWCHLTASRMPRIDPPAARTASKK